MRRKTSVSQIFYNTDKAKAMGNLRPKIRRLSPRVTVTFQPTSNKTLRFQQLLLSLAATWVKASLLKWPVPALEKVKVPMPAPTPGSKHCDLGQISSPL